MNPITIDRLIQSIEQDDKSAWIKPLSKSELIQCENEKREKALMARRKQTKITYDSWRNKAYTEDDEVDLEMGIHGQEEIQDQQNEEQEEEVEETLEQQLINARSEFEELYIATSLAYNRYIMIMERFVKEQDMKREEEEKAINEYNEFVNKSTEK